MCVILRGLNKVYKIIPSPRVSGRITLQTNVMYNNTVIRDTVIRYLSLLQANEKSHFSP